MTENYELVIATYRDTGTAKEALQTLQKAVKSDNISVVTAASISKDASGKTKVDSTLEIASQKGTRRGALAGGLLAILAPPIGILGVAAGAAAGGIVGRRMARKPESDFASSFLKGVEEQMTGQSSALVVLTDENSGESVAAAVEKHGGALIQQPLTQETVDAFLQERERTGHVPGLTDEEVERLRNLVRSGTQRQGPQFERVYVIVNPASGQDATILNTLNSVFRASGLDWDVAITKKAGDATRLAAGAAEAGYDVVAAYGGDGTVMEAATGLAGTDVPLAILPGGTNNVMSVELGVPKDLVDAAALVGAAPAEIRSVDMGRANQHDFILRVGVGYEAVINETADREMKDRFGGLAYTLAGIKALKDPPIANYKLTMDGRVEEIEGLWCMVANSASLGAPNLDLVKKISVSDGLLDVIVVRQADLDSLLSVLSSVTGREKLGKPLPHWQAKDIVVEAAPQQAVTGDGEIWEPTPLHIEVIPQAVNILVPLQE